MGPAQAFPKSTSRGSARDAEPGTFVICGVGFVAVVTLMEANCRNGETLTAHAHLILNEYVRLNRSFPTVTTLGDANRQNSIGELKLGTYRPFDAKKLVTADYEVVLKFQQDVARIPTFLEAGPRRLLYHNPYKVKAAIVTTGGLAPGLNSIVHSIVNRHHATYKLNRAAHGVIYGVYDGFDGFRSRSLDMQELEPAVTEEWVERGGSELGSRRTPKGDPATFAADIAEKLRVSDLDILYVIGGNGSQTLAHEIAIKGKRTSVVGVPKTIDNDIVWVWQSFGFNTAVEKATEVINIMHAEARSTRRLCIIELFGAESGFVAANAALASAHVDLVLIPEAFRSLSAEQCETTLKGYVSHLQQAINRDPKRPHGLVVLAEGVGKLLCKEKSATLDGKLIQSSFGDQLKEYLAQCLTDRAGRSVEVIVNRPQHNIRAIRANSHDQIYCERLGALAVDNALAGYTDFMISQWLTEYVLVPLELVAGKRKSIPPEGMFWKQVCRSTGQPSIPISRTKD